MADYAFAMRRTADASKTVGSLAAAGASPRRAKIYDIILGSEGTPGDNPFLWILQRFTAAGTSSAVTPTALSPADQACLAVGGENHTVEPTYTAGAIPFKIALNQRATFRWVAAKEDGKLVIPATAGNGIGVTTPVMAAVLVTANMTFEE